MENRTFLESPISSYSLNHGRVQNDFVLVKDIWAVSLVARSSDLQGKYPTRNQTLVYTTELFNCKLHWKAIYYVFMQ